MTVVLIPGLLCDAYVWQPVLARIGAAKVADLTTQRSITEMAQSCLDATPGPLQVVGHSMGARVAMEMARLAPDRVRRLALLDTGIHPLRPGEAEKRAEIVNFANEHGMTALAQRWLPGMVHRQTPELMADLTQMVERMTPAIHARQIEALIGRPVAAEYLPQITCPVLLVVGEQDQWSPVSQHRDMLDLLPNARLEIIPGAGHFAPVEAPDQLADLLADFLTLAPEVPETPLYRRDLADQGYALNKMANSLGRPDNRAAFKADEAAYLDRFDLSAEQKQAVLDRDWARMVAMGGNLFYILKISAVDPVPITAIGAAQAGMEHLEFLQKRLGKQING